MTIGETMLPEFDQEMKNTRKMLGCVPDDKLTWQPHEKSMTLGRLASHVAEMGAWAKHTLEVTVLELQPGHKPFCAGSQAELLEAFDRNAAEARGLIAQATDEEFSKTWELKYGGQTMMSMPRTAVMRTIVMNHMIHHRAQLSVYLRLVDVEVPGMYGPSADEMKFWQPPTAAGA